MYDTSPSHILNSIGMIYASTVFGWASYRTLHVASMVNVKWGVYDLGYFEQYAFFYDYENG